MTNYYSENFEKFIDDTFNCDMSKLYQLFESHLYKDAKCILDLGFGSGRDSIYFSKKYKIYSIDPEIKFCNHGKELGLKYVFQLSVLDMNFESKFDGIWACASLLHVNGEDLKKAFHNCYNALKKDGIMYCSFKYGDFEGIRNERYYIDLTEETIKQYVEDDFEIINTIITKDVRENNNGNWLNAILKRKV